MLHYQMIMLSHCLTKRKKTPGTWIVLTLARFFPPAMDTGRVLLTQ